MYLVPVILVKTDALNVTTSSSEDFKLCYRLKDSFVSTKQLAQTRMGQIGELIFSPLTQIRIKRT